MFLVVLGLHARGDGGIPIGGRLRPVWTVLLGVVVVVLMTQFNPFYFYGELSYDFWAEEYDRTLLETMNDLFFEWTMPTPPDSRGRRSRHHPDL